MGEHIAGHRDNGTDGLGLGCGSGQVSAVCRELLLGVLGILPARDIARQRLRRSQQLIDIEGGVHARRRIGENGGFARAGRLGLGAGTDDLLNRSAQRLSSASPLKARPVGPQRLGFELERRQMLARAHPALLLLAQFAHAGVLGLRGSQRSVVSLDGVSAGLEVVATPGSQSLEVHCLLGKQPPRLPPESLEVTLQALQLRGVPLLFPLRLASALVESLLVVLIDLRAEQRSQHPLPIGVARQQKLREAVLGEKDHLQELLVRQAHHLIDRVAHISRSRCVPDPPLSARRVRFEPFQQRVGRDDGHAGAAALGALVVRRPGDAPPVGAGAELQRDLGRVVGYAVVTAQTPFAAVVARNGAVEGEADGIEDAGLARPGSPGNNEHAGGSEGVEVDILPLAEGAESLDLDPVDPHARASATVRPSITSAMSAVSASVAPSPSRTWARKASMSSPSVRAVRTRWA